MEKAIPNQSPAPSYRSGTAARLAGIPVATLRMWERRYGVVGPLASAGGHRRYSPEDVDRLALIKALVDLGHPIGTVANLSPSALRGMQAPATAPPAETAPARLRVAIVGEALAARADSAAGRPPSLQIVAVCADRAQAASALRGIRADVLAIELPTLRDDAVDAVDALATLLGARRAVVSYRFATEAARRELRRRGHAVAHAPIDLAEIAVLGAGPGAAAAVVPVRTAAGAPRFDERGLAQLAQVSSTVRCECPKHVVDLLLSIGAFERYSAECENRSPADAELHRYLGRIAGSARTLFEEALVRVAQAEGIALPATTAPNTASRDARTAPAPPRPASPPLRRA